MIVYLVKCSYCDEEEILDGIFSNSIFARKRVEQMSKNRPELLWWYEVYQVDKLISVLD